MTWVRIDDGFFDNPINRALGAAGRDLFIAGLTYCAKGLTDGDIAKTDLALVLAQAQASKATVRKLVDVGRWVDRGDHFEVSEYLTYNPSRTKVLADRRAATERQRSLRESRRDKPRDSRSDNERESRLPRPRPVPTDSSSPNGFHSDDPQPVDDEGIEEVLSCFADLKQGRAGTIDNPARWRAAVIANARTEHGDTIRRWLDEFDLPAQRLAAGLIDGPHPTWSQHRTRHA